MNVPLETNTPAGAPDCGNGPGASAGGANPSAPIPGRRPTSGLRGAGRHAGIAAHSTRAPPSSTTGRSSGKPNPDAARIEPAAGPGVAQGVSSAAGIAKLAPLTAVAGTSDRRSGPRIAAAGDAANSARPLFALCRTDGRTTLTASALPLPTLNEVTSTGFGGPADHHGDIASPSTSLSRPRGNATRDTNPRPGAVLAVWSAPATRGARLIASAPGIAVFAPAAAAPLRAPVTATIIGSGVGNGTVVNVAGVGANARVPAAPTPAVCTPREVGDAGAVAGAGNLGLATCALPVPRLRGMGSTAAAEAPAGFGLAATVIPGNLSCPAVAVGPPAREKGPPATAPGPRNFTAGAMPMIAFRLGAGVRIAVEVRSTARTSLRSPGDSDAAAATGLASSTFDPASSRAKAALKDGPLGTWIFEPPGRTVPAPSRPASPVAAPPPTASQVDESNPVFRKTGPLVPGRAMAAGKLVAPGPIKQEATSLFRPQVASFGPAGGGMLHSSAPRLASPGRACGSAAGAGLVGSASLGFRGSVEADINRSSASLLSSW